MKTKKHNPKHLSEIENDGYEYQYSTGGNAFYHKGKFIIVWCEAHHRFVQKMQLVNGKYKIL